MPLPCKPTPQRGFTLIELMVVVAVAAILLAVAVPSFSDLMTRNRIAAAANEFIAAVTYARSEAIRTGGTTGICASSDQATCSGSWSDGWLVWGDADRDGALDPEEVLRVGGVTDRDTFTATDVGTEIRFTRRGLVDEAYLNAAVPDAAFTIEPQECTAGKPHVRSLVLTLTGQLRLSQGYCS